MAAFLENIILGKKRMGIEIFSIANQDYYAFIQTEEKKKELAITKNETATTIDSFIKEAGKSPVSLVINNNQVLQKQVEGNDANDKKLLHKAFPNINLDDFYYEIVRLKYNSIIAICRKSYITELLDSFKELRIYSISLGICAIGTLLHFSLPETLSTNTQTLSLEGEYSPNTELNRDYDINGLRINNKYLLALSGILKLILNPAANTGNCIALSNDIAFKNRQKAIFEKGIKGGLITILGVLLINFFAFSYYFDKSNSIKETIALNKVSIENITKARERVKNKEEKVEDITSQSLSKSSYIINEITKGLPSSILLTEINYAPLEKKIKDEEAVIITDNIILVSGNTLDSGAFTLWVSATEKMDWVEKVTILSFGKNQENRTEFEIRITTNQ